MEECYEFFSCLQFKCISYKNKHIDCWLTEGDCCKTHTEAMSWLREEMVEKPEACKLCLYYQFRNE